METPVRYREHRVPLEGIEETVEAVVELYGGDVTERDPNRVAFALSPDREEDRLECRVSWQPDPDGAPGQGVIMFEGPAALAPPRSRRILLLLIGAGAGVLSLMWPFFPQLGPILVVSAIVAIATFLITLRMNPGGVGGDMLSKIARTQRMENEKREGETSAEPATPSESAARPEPRPPTEDH